MTPEGHNELLPAIEAVLKYATEPLDCNQLFDMQEIRSAAPSANRVSDYLGILFRKGKVSRVANERSDTVSGRARWAYVWKNKELPEWKRPKEVIDYKPKAILARPSIYITEDGDNINIELPHLSIVIKKKN
jgi:hypothetical protein